MEDNLFTNEDNGNIVPENETEETKSQETFIKPAKNRKIEYIEREVDRFDFDGFEVVRREFFSKANCPAITLKYGQIIFNVCAIKKLDECSHILILINSGKKSMAVKPCDEDDKDSLQWKRINKHEKMVARAINGKLFTAQLFKDMKWDLRCTFKMLGTLLINKSNGEKIFEFNLVNAERYLSLAKPTDDNPKRRERVAYIPEHWNESYGQSYEESKIPIIETFEEMDGYVKITLPQLPHKKSVEKTEQDNSNEKTKEETKDGTKDETT